MQFSVLINKMSEKKILLLLLFFAFIFRIYAALVPGIIVTDGVMYINNARFIENGEWQKIVEQGFYNFYPFLIAVFHKLISDWELCARTVSIIFGSLAIIPYFFIVRYVFNSKIALISAIFFVISPRLVEYSSNVLREPVFWFFGLLALWAALEGARKSIWFYFVLSAFCVGLATFTRMEGIVLVPIILFWIIWHYVGEKILSLKQVMAYTLIFLLSFPVLFFSPLILLKAKLGHWELGPAGSRIPQMVRTKIANPDKMYQQYIDESDNVTVLLSGNKYLVTLWQPIYKFFHSYHVLFILLFILGITRRKSIPYNSREILLVSWLLFFFIACLIYFSRTYYLSSRHGMLMGWPAFAWVSVGLHEFIDVLEKLRVYFRFAEKAREKMILAVMVMICVIVLPSTLSWSGADKTEMKKAGILLRNANYSTQKLVIESRLNRLAFYAGAKYTTIPENIKASEMASFLKSSGSNYLIIDKKTMGPSVMSFVKNPHPVTLKQIHIIEFDSYLDYSFEIFKIEK